MNIDKKTVGAIATFLLAYFGYKAYLDQKYPERFKIQAEQAEQARQASLAQGDSEEEFQTPPSSEGQTRISEDEASSPAPEQLDQAQLFIENDVVKIQFNQTFGGIESLDLKKYSDDDGSGPMRIVKSPFTVRGSNSDVSRHVNRTFSAAREKNELSFTREDAGWRITETYVVPESGYGGELKVSWTNLNQQARELNSAVTMQEKIMFAAKSSSFLPGMPTGRPSLISASSGKTGDWQDIQEFCENAEETEINEGLQELDFVGFDKHYFLKVLVPNARKSHLRTSKSDVKTGQSCVLASTLSLPQGLVNPGQTIAMSYRTWFGPNSTDLLVNFEPKLKETVDLGIFGIISGPLFSVMKAIEGAVGNWGLAIILLTLLIKIVFYPLTRQAAIAQNKMKKLQPEINRIKEKYKDDQRRQQQEIMKFMSTNKINPAKGCLPVLPQFPVFIAFYRLLSTSIELRQAPFYGWITDLSVADPYYVTPLLLGVTMVVQQKLVPNAGFDKAQQRIMMVLPLVFTVMMLTLPAGMVLYMLTNTIVSIGQQQWLNKRLKA